MKKRISLFIVVLICLLCISPTYASDMEIKLNSKYAYLYDRQTSQCFYNQNGDERIYPASMTKVVTVALALEKIQNLQEVVTVTQSDLNGLAAAHATVAGFYAGEKVTYEDLIYGALLPSGADACNVLARLLFGDMNQMIKAMNDQFSKLGLKDTHFVNPTGLHDEQHYTTAKEMTSLLNWALENENFVKAFQTRKYTDSKGKRTWVSVLQRADESKKLDTSHIDGAKSGFTDEAQLTLASTMTVSGHQFILITAKAQGQRTMNNVKDAVTVYQYLDTHYQKYIIYKKEEEIHTYWILKSFQGIYSLNAEKEISILIDKKINQTEIETKYVGKRILEAPIDKNDSIGNIKVTHKEDSLYQYNLYPMQTLESNILAIILHYFIIILFVGTILLLVLRKIINRIRKQKKKNK